MPLFSEIDTVLMRQALHLAVLGRGGVEPNPLVGCVIARDGRVIGTGHHQRYGGPHAEPVALAHCTESPAGATAYVTLEPCCHVDKQTPPCVPQLIEARLSRVVIGCIDPNPDIAGRGIAQLRAGHLEVDAGLLEGQARQLIAPFFARVLHGRPYVTLKWAQTRDGRVAGSGGRTLKISNATSTRIVHELRSRCDAILVGINTVLRDDPLLTARGVAASRPLLRIVLDGSLRLPLDCQLVASARESPVWVWASARTIGEQPAKVQALRLAGVNVGESLPSLKELFGWLHAREVTHLLVEPGPTLARAFLASGLADRVWVFRSAAKLHEPGAPAAEVVDYPVIASIGLGGDTLSEYLNPASDVFFAPSESPDLLLIKERKLATDGAQMNTDKKI